MKKCLFLCSIFMSLQLFSSDEKLREQVDNILLALINGRVSSNELKRTNEQISKFLKMQEWFNNNPDKVPSDSFFNWLTWIQNQDYVQKVALPLAERAQSLLEKAELRRVVKRDEQQ